MDYQRRFWKGRPTMKALIISALILLSILPTTAGNEGRHESKPIDPTFLFLPEGVYDMGVRDGKRIRYYSKGHRAEDVMVVCNLTVSEVYLANRMCAEPIAENTAEIFDAAYDPGSDGWSPEVQLLREAVVAQALPLDAAPNGTLQLQPPKGWAFTGVDTIAYLELDDSTLTTPFTVAGLEGRVTRQVAYVVLER